MVKLYLYILDASPQCDLLSLFSQVWVQGVMYTQIAHFGGDFQYSTPFSSYFFFTNLSS